MGELLLFVIAGALVIALGLWIFSNFALFIGIALIFAIVAFGLALVRWGMLAVSDYLTSKSLSATPPAPVIEEARAAAPTVLDATREAIAVVQRSIQAEIAAAGAVSPEAKQLLNQVEERKKFVKDNHIDTLLCSLLSTMWHYPSWSKRDDAGRWVKAPVTFIDSPAEEATRSKHTISFSYENHTFHLTLKEWPNYTGDAGCWGDLTLTDADSNLLAAINVSRSEQAEYHHWIPTSVSAFKPGEWVPLLFALQGQINVAKRLDKIEAESGTAKLGELRASFDI